MRIHDTGPRTETDSDAKKRFWGHDYGTQGGELERPFIDDEPSPFDPKTPAIGGLFHRVWSRVRRIVGDAR